MEKCRLSYFEMLSGEIFVTTKGCAGPNIIPKQAGLIQDVDGIWMLTTSN